MAILRIGPKLAGPLGTDQHSDHDCAALPKPGSREEWGRFGPRLALGVQQMQRGIPSCGCMGWTRLIQKATPGRKNWKFGSRRDCMDWNYWKFGKKTGNLVREGLGVGVNEVTKYHFWGLGMI